MLDHEQYLKVINEKVEDALKHPFVALMDEQQRQIFRIAFLNGCHAMQEYYAPVVLELEGEILAYVEQENGEST